MKIGIIGAGTVARATALAVVMRGVATEVVIVDRTRQKAEGLALDVGYGAMLSPATVVRAGDYPELSGTDLVLLTAGVNEKTGGATDRSDSEGRLRLLAKNAEIFRDIVPRIAKAAPDTVLVVVTDPPDPLADIARSVAPRLRVISAGTFLDSLRFRLHLSRRLEVHPGAVDAMVLGEHGTSSVFLWSAARLGGSPALSLLGGDATPAAIEKEVREANIAIIEGIGASQLGIGMVGARIAEIMARDERAVLPLGCYSEEYGVTLSLPVVLGREGVLRQLTPPMTEAEHAGMRKSADHIRQALERIGTG